MTEWISRLPAGWYGVLAQAGKAGQAAQEAAQDAAVATGAPGWLLLIALIVICVIPFVLGWAIARGLRMHDVAGRLGICLFALFLGLAPFLWNVTLGLREGVPVGESLRRSIRLGVDLAGGTNLVYQVVETPEKPLTDKVLDKMVGSIILRINPSGTEEVTVRRVGRDRIEVIVPGAEADKVRRIKSKITQLGSLEFAILANQNDHPSLISLANRLPGTERDVYQGSRIAASWKSVAREKEGGWKEGPSGEFPQAYVGTERYVNSAGEIVPAPENLDAPPENLDRQLLTVLDPPERRVNGEFLVDASAIRDDSGQPAVSFTFNQKGGRRFGILTSANRPTQDGFFRRLAILLDDKVHSAPRLNQTITTRGQITGSFTDAEVTQLVDVLNAGALEVPIEPSPVSEFTISPLLGEDTVRKSVSAILWSGVLVFVFMAAYYWAAGLIADLALALNIILVLGSMSFIDATFTLPGLAGLVLTIGMAVDANVLIFERIREEKERGSSLRLSIQNGFDRALGTIIDANVTTLITAVILYLIGTDAVRGFAVTLFIGILMSMFTAIFFGRMMFEILEKRRLLGSLKMASLPLRRHFDFMSVWVPATLASVVLIVIGLGVLFSRGASMLDIDFLGGTMITFQLEEPSTSAKVREALNDVSEFRGNVSVERLVLADEGAGEAGTRFRMRTTMQDETDATTPADEQRTVAGLVAEAFEKSKLNIRRVTMQTGPVSTVGGEGEAVAGSFNGGPQATVTLDEGEEMSTDTLLGYFGDALATIRSGSSQKYAEPATLIRATGTAGRGLDAAENEAKTFSKMRLEAAPVVSAADFSQALDVMRAQLANSPVFDEVNSFDGAVASEMQQSALMAILASWAAIIGYLWFRFQNIAFGIAAVAALVHDVLITLGAVAIAAAIAGSLGFNLLGLEEFKINLPMVAAIMTLIGYSINDTIVVFDRIREVRGKSALLTREIVNTSLNQTLSRTLLTALTTLIVVVILYFFGGEGIHGFAYVLVIGIIVGTYSSVYIACPILLWLVNRGTPQPKTTTLESRQPVTR